MHSFLISLLLASFPAKEVSLANDISEVFALDFETRTAGVDITFSHTRMHCGSRGLPCLPHVRTLKTLSLPVPGLVLVDDELLFGDVVCGDLRPGRIFRHQKVLHLSGRCSFEYREVDSELRVFFVTK